MTQYERIRIFLLRISLGWLLFYAGITKVLDPQWSAEGYLRGAKTFSGFYAWLAEPGMLSLVNAINAWGLTLIGAALILGIFVRLSSILGAGLMILYYFPILQFPYPNQHSFVVDEHIAYATALLVLAALRAGRIWGLETWCANLPICSRYPRIRSWIG